MKCWILSRRYKQYYVKIMHLTNTIACHLFVESLHAIFPAVRSFKGFFFPILNKSYRTHTILPAARGDLLANCTPCTQWEKYGHQALSFEVTCNQELPLHAQTWHLQTGQSSEFLQKNSPHSIQWQLQTLTRYLWFKKQRGSGGAESCAGGSP